MFQHLLWDEIIVSQPLKQVIKHLRKLRTKLDKLESADDWQAVFEKRRNIAEAYDQADISIKAIPEDITRLSVGLFETIKGEWFYQPESVDTQNRLLYIHGCGGAHGRLSSRLNFAAKIAKATATAVLAVDYRQLPQYPYAATLADCLAAYAWILAHGPYENSISQHTYVLGEAEGGTLALSTLQNIKQRDLKTPTAAVAVSPLTDWSGTSKSWSTLESTDPFLSRNFLSEYWTHFFGDINDPKDPSVSPLYGDFKGLPPLLLQVGGGEILLDDSKRLADTVSAIQGRVNLDISPGMPHAFQLFSPYLDEATSALKRIGDFIHSHNHTQSTENVVYMRPKTSKHQEKKQ